MIVGDSRKHRNPVSSCKKPVQPLFNMILIDLIVSPSVNITMEPKVHKVTVIKSVIKQSDKVVVVTTTPRLFIRVSNQVKITKQKPIVMHISPGQVRNKLTSKIFLIGFGVTINPCSSPTI
jgi:hypothetical protein